MVTDPEAEDEDPRGGPRVAFQIASSSIIQPAKTSNWQWGLAFVLGVLTIATAFQLGLVANVSMLPKVRCCQMSGTCLETASQASC